MVRFGVDTGLVAIRLVKLLAQGQVALGKGVLSVTVVARSKTSKLGVVSQL